MKTGFAILAAGAVLVFASSGLRAAPIAPSDSAFALSRKPQVFTMTRSEPACSRESS